MKEIVVGTVLAAGIVASVVLFVLSLKDVWTGDF